MIWKILAVLTGLTLFLGLIICMVAKFHAGDIQGATLYGVLLNTMYVSSLHYNIMKTTNQEKRHDTETS